MECYRFLQQQGFGSRKECRKLIEHGLVELDGDLIEDYRQEVDQDMAEELVVDDQPWQVVKFPVYIAFHKPADFETSHKPIHNRSVFQLLPWQFNNIGVQAVGRLDVDTTGLLLFTSNGQCVHALTSPNRHVAKVYEVVLKHEVTDDFIRHLQNGVYLKDDDEKIKADSVQKLDPFSIEMTISQGKYHQVKRMVAAASNRVNELHRVAMGPIRLGDLDEGEWRLLNQEEIDQLPIAVSK